MFSYLNFRESYEKKLLELEKENQQLKRPSFKSPHGSDVGMFRQPSQSNSLFNSSAKAHDKFSSNKGVGYNRDMPVLEKEMQFRAPSSYCRTQTNAVNMENIPKPLVAKNKNLKYCKSYIFY